MPRALVEVDFAGYISLNMRWFCCAMQVMIGCSPIFAQDTIRRAESLPRCMIKLAPLHLLNGYYDQSVRVSVELRSGKKLTSQFEYGIYPDGFNQGEVTGFQIGAQLRQYFNLTDRNHHGFSLGLLYKDQVFDTGDSTWSGPTTSNYFKDYRMVKRVVVLSLQYILAGPLDRSAHWWIEGALGVSGRYKNAICTGLTEEEIKNRDFGDSMVLGTTKVCFTGLRFSLEINVRIGYAIW